MRKLIYLLLAVLAVHSCNDSNKGYTLLVDLETSDGKWVKLMSMEERNYVVRDSALSESNTPAALTNSIDGVTTMYLTVEGDQGTIKLLMENANYKISGTLENPIIKTDSKAQNDLNDYNKKLRPINDKMAELARELRKGPDGVNPEITNSIREDYYKLIDKKKVVDSLYITENPSSYATVLALRGTFFNLNTEELEAALTNLDPSLQKMEEFNYMKGKLERQKAVAIGQPFIDFELATPEGGSLTVSDVHNGNVLLIDFWASWCGPCRRENPEVVELYAEYHDRGFEILGVSLDRDSVSWVKAIANDNLTWHHISDLKYWNSEGAQLYGVPAIPHTVLIDRNGIIAAKKLHGDELSKAIESLL